MASALTVIARQTGFATGVAVLGALTPSDLHAGGFVWPFGFAAAAALGGVLACLLLPGSTKLPEQREPGIIERHEKCASCVSASAILRR